MAKGKKQRPIWQGFAAGGLASLGVYLLGLLLLTLLLVKGTLSESASFPAVAALCAFPISLTSMTAWTGFQPIPLLCAAGGAAVLLLGVQA